METSKAAGTYVDERAGKVPFKEYADEWLRNLSVRQSTVNTYGAHLRSSIYPWFETRTLGNVKRSDVIAWAKERTDSGMAPSTIRTAYKVLSMLFRSAVDDGLIARSPCYRITNLPKVERRDEAVVALTPAEVIALADAMPERYRAMVLVAAGTGLRQGECFGLTRDRVDFMRRTVKVDRQLLMDNSGATGFGKPKTDASYRTVPVPEMVADALADHLATHEVAADGLLWTSPLGFGIRRNRFHESWVVAVESAGLPKGTRFHQLRHTYASLLIAAKEPPKVIQERLGHSSITETMDTYGHLYPESEESTRAAIDAAFRSLPEAKEA